MRSLIRNKKRKSPSHHGIHLRGGKGILFITFIGNYSVMFNQSNKPLREDAHQMHVEDVC